MIKILLFTLIPLTPMAQDLMSTLPVRLEVEGIPRVGITEPQYDAVILHLSDAQSTSEELLVATRMMLRQDSIIASYERELSLRDLVDANNNKQIANQEKQIKGHELKEKVRNTTRWIERGLGVLLGGLGIYGGYELGRLAR
jgi:hypothetical protein